MLTSVWRTAWLKGCVRKVHPLVADWCIASMRSKLVSQWADVIGEMRTPTSIRIHWDHQHIMEIHLFLIHAVFEKHSINGTLHVPSQFPAWSSLQKKKKKKTVYNSCMENAVKNWSSGWLKMLVYIVKPQTFAYGPQWCVMQLCFLFYLGWKQRYQTVHGKEGGTKAQDFLTSMLHEHKLVHHTYCTVQLFSPQPESSHAEERWRGGKRTEQKRRRVWRQN